MGTLRWKISLGLAALLVLVSASVQAPKPSGQSGATLQAFKTIDICDLGNRKWRYSGVVSVWNEDLADTQGLKIVDCVQNKASGSHFTDQYCTILTDGSVVVIPAGALPPFGLDTSWSPRMELRKVAGDGRDRAEGRRASHRFG